MNFRKAIVECHKKIKMCRIKMCDMNNFKKAEKRKRNAKCSKVLALGGGG